MGSHLLHGLFSSNTKFRHTVCLRGVVSCVGLLYPYPQSHPCPRPRPGKIVVQAAVGGGWFAWEALSAGQGGSGIHQR